MPHRPFSFIRHGQTDWNVIGRMQGLSDIPLNANGIAGAHAAASRLKSRNIDLIVTSPLKRAHHTATIIAQTLNLPVEIDESIVERCFGDYEGKFQTDIRQALNLPEETALGNIPMPGGESWGATKKRGREAISKWLRQCEGKNLLFVSHSAFFRALHEELCGTLYTPANTIPYHLQPAVPYWKLTEL